MVTFEEANAIVNKRIFLVKHPTDNNILIGEDGITWYDITQKTKEEVETIINSFYKDVDLKIDAGWIRIEERELIELKKNITSLNSPL